MWGLIIPGLLTGLLLVLPYLEVGPSRRYGDRRIGLSAGALFVAALAILSYMGTPYYGVTTSPDQEAVAEMLPQTHPGPLRSAPWEDLTLESYEAAAWSSAPNATLQDEGEFQASQKLAEAAAVISAEPGALQLRFMQTLTEIATEKNSTILFPIPIDLIKPFMDKK